MMTMEVLNLYRVALAMTTLVVSNTCIGFHVAPLSRSCNNPSSPFPFRHSTPMFQKHVHRVFLQSAGAVVSGHRRCVDGVLLCTVGEEEIEAKQVSVGARDEFGLDDKALEELWRKPRKHLFSIGKSGIKPSHVRSLVELVQAHTLVKVKINIPDADFDLVSLQLCGRAPISGVEPNTDGPAISMVMYRETQNVILFTETAFLAEYAEERLGKAMK